MSTIIDPAGEETKALVEAAAFAGARVLEIGSGSGRLARRCAGIAGVVVGLESSGEEVAAAAGPASIRHGPRFVRGSGVRLPFRAARFDIALFGWSL